MQVRYQLRHSPIAVPGSAAVTTRGILANSVRRKRNRGSPPAAAAGVSRLVVRREPQPSGAVLRDDWPSRSCPARAGPRRPRRAGRAAPAARPGWRRRGVTTTPVSPGASAASISRSAGTIRARTVGDRLRAGHPAGHVARRPSARTPRGTSRRTRRWSARTAPPRRTPAAAGRWSARRPVACSTYAAVWRARRRSLDQSAPGRSAASSGADRGRLGVAGRRRARRRLCPWARPRGSRPSARGGAGRAGAGRDGAAVTASPLRGTVTSAGSSMAGQSRQSRSRA